LRSPPRPTVAVAMRRTSSHAATVQERRRPRSMSGAFAMFLAELVLLLVARTLGGSALGSAGGRLVSSLVGRLDRRLVGGSSGLLDGGLGRGGLLRDIRRLLGDGRLGGGLLSLGGLVSLGLRLGVD